MNHYIRKGLALMVLLATMAMFLVPKEAQAVPARYRVGHDPVAMMVDGVVARPLGLASTVIGSAFFLVTLPFTIPSHSVESAKKQMIDYPAWFTFKRPLGEFGRRYERPVIHKTNQVLTSNSTASKEPDNPPVAESK
ncbi:MAG: hypothetical protein GXO58_03050 [Thermodesulfobacteria bacterium]|nr:hypothetical protein [Thermodesulfobacteriota bacterium]